MLRHLLPVLIVLTPLAGEDAARQRLRAELDVVANEATRLSRAFNLVHELVGPSVVSVRTRDRVINPWTGRAVREVPMGEGSGFVFASDATQSWVVTNAHVVLKTDADQTYERTRDGRYIGFDRLRVVLNDNRECDATYVGAYVQSDLAVLRLPVPDLPPVQWADSDQVHVGDWVVALGYPLGVGYSATAGIVSATDKSTGVYEGVGGFESFIQTDAAINPGNSGGPLVTLRGTIAGVNSNIKPSVGGTNLGLGFAIPANMARRVAEDLLAHGQVRQGVFGVQLDELDADQARRLGLPPAAVVRIAQVVPMTPAASARLQVSDIIQAIDQWPIRSAQQFRARLAVRRPGETVTVRVWRGGTVVEAAVQLLAYEELEQRLSDAAQVQAARGVALPGFGLRLAADGDEGLAVVGVEAGSAADDIIAVGDRIMQEGTLGPLRTADDLRRLAERREIVIQVRHGSRTAWYRLRR
jgi:S1-C subfamily serine protease